VLIANKMESSGETEHINVSQRTKDLLEKKYPGEYRFNVPKKVSIETLNVEIQSYLLETDAISTANKETDPEHDRPDKSHSILQQKRVSFRKIKSGPKHHDKKDVMAVNEGICLEEEEKYDLKDERNQKSQE